MSCPLSLFYAHGIVGTRRYSPDSVRTAQGAEIRRYCIIGGICCQDNCWQYLSERAKHIAVHRTDLCHIQRFVEYGEKRFQVPASLSPWGDRYQYGLRSFSTRIIIVEGNTRYLGSVRDDLIPFIQQQPGPGLGSL